MAYSQISNCSSNGRSLKRKMTGANIFAESGGAEEVVVSCRPNTALTSGAVAWEGAASMFNKRLKMFLMIFRYSQESDSVQSFEK